VERFTRTRAAATPVNRRQCVGARQRRVLPPGVRRGAPGRVGHVAPARSLSATLLVRGLSFWLPMLPGYWCSRRGLAEPGPTCLARVVRLVGGRPLRRRSCVPSLLPPILRRILQASGRGRDSRHLVARDLGRCDSVACCWNNIRRLIVGAALLGSTVSPDVARFAAPSHFYAFVVSGPLSRIAMTVSSVVILQTGVFPRWLGWADYTIGAPGLSATFKVVLRIKSQP
jgi:hypothetical protein